MPPYIHDISVVSYHSIPSFKFQDGTVLDIKVAYREWNPKGRKTVLNPTAMGGHIATSNPFNAHPSEPFYSDPSSQDASSSYRVIVAGMLGNGESTSPSHYPPSSSSPAFPSKISYVDVVRAHYNLLTVGLGLTSLDVVMGTSMGGQQCWYWASLYGIGPEPFVKNVIPICTSCKTSFHNITMLDGLIGALETPLILAGQQNQNQSPALYQPGRDRTGNTNPQIISALHSWHRGYAAWLTSPEWFRRQLWREMPSRLPDRDGHKAGDTYTTLQEYLNPSGTSYETWSPIDLICLARMWQDGDVGECLSFSDTSGRGSEDSWKRILPLITARVLLMPSTTDQYFRVEDAEEQFRYLSQGDGGMARHEWAPIETCWGHLPLSNPQDRAWIAERVKKFLGER